MRCTFRPLVLVAVGLLGVGLLTVAAPAQSKIDKEHAEFARKFKEGKELNDNKRVLRALRDYHAAAILEFEKQLDKFVFAGDNAAGDRVEEFKELWPKAWEGSQLLDKIERWRAGLEPSEIDMISKLTGQENVAWRIYETAKKEKKKREFETSLDGMMRIAERYEEIGAKLRAAKAWNLYCSMMHGWTGDKNEGHRDRLISAMERYLELNEDMDWTKHPDYAMNKNWFEGIKRQIEHDKKKGQKGKVNLKKPGEDKDVASLLPYAKGSKWEPATLNHRVMKRPTEGITRFASASPQWWLGQLLQGMEKTEFKFFKDGKIWMQRLGPNKYVNLVDEDATPTKKDEVNFGQDRKPTEIWYSKGDSAINYYYFMYVGGGQEPWIGSPLNWKPEWRPDRKIALIVLRSASHFSANINGVELTLYDENINGVFGDKFVGSGFGDWMVANDKGTEEAGFHPAFDSMKLGKGTVVPFSPIVKLGDTWYSLKVIGNNEKLRYRPLDTARVKTGAVAVKWKGSKKARPKHLVIRETSGAWPQAAFDVMAGGSKGIEVPVGTYEIFYGRVYGGRPPRNMDAIILQGDSKSVVVKPGEKTVINMGAPFSIEYNLDKTGQTATVSTATMWVKDSSGCKFTCIAAEILEPELVVAKTMQGRGAKVVGEWRRPAGLETNKLTERYDKMDGRALRAFGIDKTTGKDGRFDISVKLPRGQFIGVRQKKHKMFGKLLPVWK